MKREQLDAMRTRDHAQENLEFTERHLERDKVREILRDCFPDSCNFVGSAITDHHDIVSREFGLTRNDTEGGDTWSNAHLAVGLLAVNDVEMCATSRHWSLRKRPLANDGPLWVQLARYRLLIAALGSLSADGKLSVCRFPCESFEFG